MKTRIIAVFSVLAAVVVFALLLSAQDVTTIHIEKGEKTVIAVPDMRGTGAAQQSLGAADGPGWTKRQHCGRGEFRHTLG